MQLLIKVSDYVVKRLVDFGVRDVFMISGGGAMHLNDSFGNSPNINYICNHHEQASAIAAEGYARVSGGLAVVIVTTGPGGTNTLTGVMGQWTDSVPVLYISGQVKQETVVSSYKIDNLRQLGDQEVNIVDIVKPITKFAEIVRKPGDIVPLLEKAIHTATEGRPGPVWLDIPLDIQGSFIQTDNVSELGEVTLEPFSNLEKVKDNIDEIIRTLSKANRPLIVAGHGIRIGKAENELWQVVDLLKIPIVSTFNGIDIVPTEHHSYVGKIGTIGTRSGNFALQNADVILFLGTRNNIRQISYSWEFTARESTKIVVDIDKAELKKPTFVPDLAVQSDVKKFLKALIQGIESLYLPEWEDWLAWCKEKMSKYPVVIPSYKELETTVHPYHFIEVLTNILPENSIIVSANATPSIALFQAGNIKKGQRVIYNSGCASMGYDLPASIGACFANEKNSVICLAGEGSIQMNIQELQTIKHYHLPIKIFVLNNDQYISIKQTQNNLFSGRYAAVDKDHGVSFPNMVQIANAYGIKALSIDSHEGLHSKLQDILSEKGPMLINVSLCKDYVFMPKLASEKKDDGRIVSKPLEDMFPFLEREEFRKNMIIDTIDEV